MSVTIESLFVVVRNHEGQYSIWPSFKPVPEGWFIAREEDSRDNCLSYIDQVWDDIRPNSLKNP